MKFEVCGSSGNVCANLRSVCYVRVSVICQCLTFFVLHFGVSAWCLNALNLWALIVKLFIEEYVSEQMVDGLKKLGECV